MNPCPACESQRVHTAEEWKNHPFAGHGYVREQGWTHPDLEIEFNRSINDLHHLHGRIAVAVEKSKGDAAQKQSEARP